MKNRITTSICALALLLIASCESTEDYTPLQIEPQFTTITSNTTNRLTRIAFVNSAVGYISGRSGTLLKTIDSGATWALIPLPTTEHIQSLSFVDTQTGWITGAKGIVFKTTDGGTTWDTLLLPTTTETMNTVKFVDQNTGWVAGAKGLIYKTIDGGATWNQQINFDTLGMKAATIANVVNNGGTVNANTGNVGTTTINQLYAIDQNTLIALANTGIIYKTLDGGKSWKWQNTSTNNSLYGINFVQPTLAYVCGANGAVLKTDGNGTFENATNKANTRSFRDIYFTTPQRGWAIGEHGYIFKSTNGGAYWGNEMLFESINILYACAFITPEIGFFVGNDGTILKVQDIKY